MTSQPPPPPGGPGQPGGPGEQPPQQPPHGGPQQPWGQQPQQPWGQQPAQPQQPWGQPPQGGYAPPGPGRRKTSVDFSKVGLFERLIAGSALLFTLFMLLPWYGFDDDGFENVDASTNGFSDAVGFGSFTFDIGYTTWPAILAWLLLLAAAVWVLLPAVTTVRVPVPRSVVTAGLAVLAALLFLITWIDQLGLTDGPDDEAGFSVVAFLALLTVLAAAVLAVLRALPELRARTAAGRQAPVEPPPGGQPPQGYGPAPQQPPYEQPYPPGSQPPPPPPPAAPGPPGPA